MLQRSDRIEKVLSTMILRNVALQHGKSTSDIIPILKALLIVSRPKGSRCASTKGMSSILNHWGSATRKRSDWVFNSQPRITNGLSRGCDKPVTSDRPSGAFYRRTIIRQADPKKSLSEQTHSRPDTPAWCSSRTTLQAASVSRRPSQTWRCYVGASDG